MVFFALLVLEEVVWSSFDVHEVWCALGGCDGLFPLTVVVKVVVVSWELSRVWSSASSFLIASLSDFASLSNSSLDLCCFLGVFFVFAIMSLHRFRFYIEVTTSMVDIYL